MMDETYLMDVIKENISFVSQDATTDLVTAKQKVLASRGVTLHRRSSHLAVTLIAFFFW